MTAELATPRFTRRSDPSKPFSAYVRIHDGGDFYNDEYLQAWMRIAESRPEVQFYCYTKEVLRFKRIAEGLQLVAPLTDEDIKNGKKPEFRQIAERSAPPNFTWLYSLGGKEDRYIDKDVDRHCDVFPTSEALESAGYSDQAESDLLSITLPTNKIGIVVNNHRDVKKLVGDNSFGQIQESRQLRLALKRLKPPRMRVVPKPEGDADLDAPTPIPLDGMDVKTEAEREVLRPMPEVQLFIPDDIALREPQFDSKGHGLLW